MSYSIVFNGLPSLTANQALANSMGWGMWIILFIVALLFVLGSALLLLRSAKTSRLPDNVKSQPYNDDDGSGW
ncbi:MAG: hypothetical protein PHR16_12375 [Methylovulum sp.]|nr:hypothetical protein [Methylovulum sp.]